MSMSFRILNDRGQPAFFEVLLIVVVVSPTTIQQDVDVLEFEVCAGSSVVLQIQ